MFLVFLNKIVELNKFDLV